MIPRLKPYYNHRELLAALSFYKKNSVITYEQEFAGLFDATHALAFPYGRSALYAIFKALKIENNEVILPAYTCIVVANAIALSGNIPRFIDITLDDYNMNLDLLEGKINENTRAIVATHLFGYPFNTDKLKDIVARAERHFGHKIWIIQDCAHSFGARWSGKLVCNEGDVAIYGLNISKVITSIFGGMVTCNNPDLYDKIKNYRDREFRSASNIKSLKRFLYLMAVQIGFSSTVYNLVNFLEEKTSIINSLTKYYDEAKIELPSDYLEHMLEIEARVGLVQLQKYNDIIQKRKAIAEYYSEHLKGIEKLELPPIKEGATYSHFVMRVANRNHILAALRKSGIQLGWLIEYSIPEMRAFKKWKTEEFPNSKLCSQTTINLPNWPGMRRSSVNKVVHALINQNKRSFTKGHAFDIHWSENLSEEIPEAKKMVAYKFLKPIIDFSRQAAQPLYIFDAGCGDGVHAQVIYEHKDFLGDHYYCGADISRDALRITSSRVKAQSNFSLFHADISKLPFEDESFDAAFSFGVIAYTEMPELSFKELYRVTKSDGLIGIWIYPQLAGLKGWLFKTIRNICRLLGPGGTRIIADMLVPFLHFLPTRSKMSLKNATWNQCREIVLVNIAPDLLYFPSNSEIEQWFKENNVQIIENDQENPITIWGRKK